MKDIILLAMLEVYKDPRPWVLDMKQAKEGNEEVTQAHDRITEALAEFIPDPVERYVFFERVANFVHANNLSDFLIDAFVRAQDKLLEQFPEIPHKREGILLGMYPVLT